MIPSAESDELLFGWDPTPGIVSAWADRDGRAIVWRRVDGQVLAERDRYRPWIVAAHLDDLAHVRLARDDDRTPFSYVELVGAAASCRFLIAARSGRELERALCIGAQRRLGRSVRGIFELPESEYYRVGPVEQYLIQRGRCYFRGLRYSDLHRMQIDFETTALDGERGRIFLAAARDSLGFEAIIEAREPQDEPQLIIDLCALIRERDPDVIENHNLHGFDLPFLERRAELLGLTLDLGRSPGPLGLGKVAQAQRDEGDDGRYRRQREVRYTLAGRELIDTLDAVRRHDFVTRDMGSHRLKDAARHFGIAAPDRVYIAGEQIFDTYRRAPEQVLAYALGDVREVDGLSQRLLPPAFALTQMAPRRYERVAYAGPAMGILEPMVVRAFLRRGQALPLPGVEGYSDLGPHSGGGLHLFATGIARNVVKADVASLYPSLMIAHAIGPKCDPAQSLLTIVTRLTELRLRHKDAAKLAEPGSLDASYHGGMQAAMKLIINAAYGYLGAGTMALFADRTAADAITSRGREVLGRVVAELERRGVALIEADTDGVYFALPETADEAAARALVADVAATMPQGIRLEYDGRYAAMFSHEVKNYALLTHDGHLIVRGVALKSSRAEPFGEQFLHTALLAALHGDVVAVRTAFVSTVDALRQRRLTAGALATRARLRKTPEEYRRSRERAREGQYEALLAAGRATWEQGERVRFYRAQGGAYIWVADERAAAATDYDVQHYLDLLRTSYASRLKKAFAPEDFAQIFRDDMQTSLFDAPIETIAPLWIMGPTEHAAAPQRQETDI